MPPLHPVGGALGPHDCLETPGAPCEPLLPGRPFCLPLPFPLSRIRSHICPGLSAPRRARLHLICGTDVSLVLCRLLTFWGSFCSSARLCLFRRTNPVHTQADHAPARGNVLCPRDLVKPTIPPSLPRACLQGHGESRKPPLASLCDTRDRGDCEQDPPASFWGFTGSWRRKEEKI